MAQDSSTQGEKKTNRWSQLLREFPQVESIAPQPAKKQSSQRPAENHPQTTTPGTSVPRPVEPGGAQQVPFSLEPLKPKSKSNSTTSSRGKGEGSREAPAGAVSERKPSSNKSGPPAWMTDDEPDAFQESSETPEAHVFSVSEINHSVKQQLEGNFLNIWLQGEISNFKAHTSGHFYFSLKDAKAQISAVMFRGLNSKLKFMPESGMEVLVQGKITVYEPRGNYQFFCEHMEPVGAGALQKAFEQLKAKLQGEGLFDESRKKPLPQFPQKVGVVTSPTGAAIRDILNVLKRRSPRVQVTVIPARVQGTTAASEVAAGIKLANKLGGFDVLIIGRGGGSIEDLWGFNEEPLARAIAASKIPIISAVGHEIDFTISDFVADLRAPTPSAAAEVVAQSEEQLLEKIKFSQKALLSMMTQKLEDRKNHLEFYSKRLKDPRTFLRDSALRCDELTSRLIQSIGRQLKHKKLKVQSVRGRMQSPKVSVERARLRLQNKDGQLKNGMQRLLVDRRRRWQQGSALLDSLSPLKVIDRGYAIVRSGADTPESQVLRSIKNQKPGDQIEVQLQDGYISAEIKSLRENASKGETQ